MSKDRIINTLREEVLGLKDKVVNFEIKTPVSSKIEKVESVSSIKRLQNLPGKELKELEKAKS